MKIDKYITELLFDHECVIVPGLGGFIVNERHAAINNVTHQFEPPFTKLLFNQHIRFNDGLLINHIAGKTALSFETVRKQVDELVHLFFQRLDKGEKIKFENIGVLSIDESKNITFYQDHSINYNAESFGLESFVSHPIKRKVEVEPVKGIVQPQPIVRKREDRKPERVVTEEFKPIHKRRNKSESAGLRSFIAVLTVTILLISSVLVFFNSETARNSVMNLTSSLILKKEKIHYNPRPEQKSETKNTMTNQAGFLSGTIFETETPTPEKVSESFTEEIQDNSTIYSEEISVLNNFNYRGRNLTEMKKEIAPETEIENPEIHAAGENVTVAEADIPIAKEEIVVKIKTVSQYYIIAGSFSDQSNAISLIDELLQKGFSAQIIDTNKNGMYRVAYLGIENLAEAKQKLYAIREEDNPEAWILKK